LFRLTSEPTKFLPPAVVVSSPRSAFHIKSAPAGSDLKLHAPPESGARKDVFLIPAELGRIHPFAQSSYRHLGAVSVLVSCSAKALSWGAFQ
jgi:hypothetical protein